MKFLKEFCIVFLIGGVGVGITIFSVGFFQNLHYGDNFIGPYTGAPFIVFLKIFVGGIFAGIAGLIYPHIFGVYYFLLRKIPDFWKRAPFYLFILYLSTLIPAVYTSNDKESYPLIAAFLCPLGLWMGSAGLRLVYGKKKGLKVT